eukprot:gene12956-biopygen7616
MIHSRRGQLRQKGADGVLIATQPSPVRLTVQRSDSAQSSTPLPLHELRLVLLPLWTSWTLPTVLSLPMALTLTEVCMLTAQRVGACMLRLQKQTKAGRQVRDAKDEQHRLPAMVLGSGRLGVT